MNHALVRGLGAGGLLLVTFGTTVAVLLGVAA